MDTITLTGLDEVPKLEAPVKESKDGKRKYSDGVDTAYYVTYNYRGCPYIPHYTKPDCYVPPAYSKPAPNMVDAQGRQLYYADVTVERSASELEKAGATKSPMVLWRRNSKSRYTELT
jgi:hypothetical protein